MLQVNHIYTKKFPFSGLQHSFQRDEIRRVFIKTYHGLSTPNDKVLSGVSRNPRPLMSSSQHELFEHWNLNADPACCQIVPWYVKCCIESHWLSCIELLCLLNCIFRVWVKLLIIRYIAIAMNLWDWAIDFTHECKTFLIFQSFTRISFSPGLNNFHSQLISIKSIF